MKKFKELTEGLSHKVPVYHEPDKMGEYELVGHVHSSATSVGAAKLAGKKSAKFTRVDGKYGWVASNHLKESSWQSYRDRVIVESAELNIPEHTVEEIANKHGFTVQHIQAQLERGIKVEGEHTTHAAPAREIALNHLWENPNYYTVLKKAQLEGCLLEEGTKFKNPTPKAKKKFVPNPKVWKKMPVLGKLLGVKLKEAKHTLYKLHGVSQKYHPKTDTWTSDHTEQEVLASSRSHALNKTLKKLQTIHPHHKYHEVTIVEELTPREKMSGTERLAPVKPVPMDHAGEQKRQLAQHDNTNDSVRKNISQGGVDSSAHKTIHHGTASKSMTIHESDKPFHKYTNDELEAAIKQHSDSASELRRFDRKSHAAYQHIQHAYAAKEILKSRKRTERGMDESVQLDELSKGTLKGYLNKAYPSLDKLTHERDYSKHKKTNRLEKNRKLGIKQAWWKGSSVSRANESVEQLSEDVSDSGYKVGDKVVPKIGPHKGTVHTVIHVHPTGHLNIKPDVHVRSNRYHLGAAKADPKDVTRHLAEASTKREFYTKKQERDPSKWLKNRGKQFKKWPEGMHMTSTGINRKTIQEIFQAAKDKKDGKPPKQDNLPNDGANEPNKDIPGAGAPGVQPQDAKGPQDGAPGEEKKDNTPKPENPNSKKIQVKGPGSDDKFQADPVVTPLTHMPDTGNPRNGSAGAR